MPGTKLSVEGLQEPGILLKDGWIEYGTDKYPDLEAWLLKLRKRNRFTKDTNVGCWEVVWARGHKMDTFREQCLEMLAQRKANKSKGKRGKVLHNKSQTRHAATKHNCEADAGAPPKQSRDYQVKRQKVAQSCIIAERYDSSSSLVDLLANLDENRDSSGSVEDAAQTVGERTPPEHTPTTPQGVGHDFGRGSPVTNEAPIAEALRQSNSENSNDDSVCQSPSVLSFSRKIGAEFHTISSTELGALAAHLDEHEKEMEQLDDIGTHTQGNLDKVILGTGMKSQMLVTLQTLVEQVGGKVVQDFTSNVTHVVTIADACGRTPRTLKYCSAVLSGAWIVSFEWVLASLAAKKWVDELTYEIKGDQHGEGAPQNARAALLQGEPRLFAGKSICLVGTFNHPSPSGTELESVLRIGGATILQSLPPLPTSMQQYMSAGDSVLVLCDPSSFSEAQAVEVQMACSLVPISYPWILDSISKYKLLPVESYKILSNEMHNLETQQSLAF
jgi:hypothetical protein